VTGKTDQEQDIKKLSVKHGKKKTRTGLVHMYASAEKCFIAS